MIQVSAIIVAAGYGLRLKSNSPKALVKIKSKPLVIYSLESLSRIKEVNEIILVANRKNLKQIKRLIDKLRIKKVKSIVLGGKERKDSVKNGLNEINREADLVLIHDAARPFISRKIILAVINLAKKHQAAIVGVPVKATIKAVHRTSYIVDRKYIVKKTLDRNCLWEIQTPQVFKRELILKAYKRFGKENVTDDAMLVEKLGKKVYLVEGSYSNIKITTPEDLIIAEAIAKKSKI